MLHWHGNVMCYRSECDPRNILMDAPQSNWQYETPASEHAIKAN